jgi:formylglycine-generating enzyme required for sulfatase activity
MQDEKESPVLIPQEGYDYLRISRPTYVKYPYAGRIKGTRVRKGWRVLKSELKGGKQDDDQARETEQPLGAEKEHFPGLKFVSWRDPYLGMEFVYLEGGQFEMGDIGGFGSEDEHPVHWVRLDGFWICKYQVTQEQWERVMGNNPSEFRKGGNYPVEGVNWYDVEEFIKRFNERTRMESRLPTEAEWEYAARSGGRRDKWSGTSDSSELEKYAWYVKNSDNETHPVGEKRPNSLGLHDMSGNVDEWVQDWYGKDYYGNSRMNNPCSGHGLNRVIRGGRWDSGAKSLRTTSRSSITPKVFGISPGVGFRLVLPARYEQPFRTNQEVREQDRTEQEKRKRYKNGEKEQEDERLVRCFEVFGLKPEATAEELKQTYRDLVNIWHPDRFNKNTRLQQKAEEQLKEINAAYEYIKTSYYKMQDE